MSATWHPGDALHVNHHVDDTAAVVQVTGEVDGYTAPLLAEHLARALATATAAPPSHVVADLRDTEFFGSGGLAALVAAH